MMITLVLLRHGQTNFNVESRMQGHIDSTLTDTGRQQARAAARGLESLGISAIYSSDLSRALETATIVGDHLGVTVTPEKRLRETFLGTWQGMKKVDIDEQFPGARGRWRDDPTWAPGGGETQVEVALRARDFVDESVSTGRITDGSTVLLVAHGGLHAALASSLLKLDLHQVRGLDRLGNCCRGNFSGKIMPPDADPHRPESYHWCLSSWNIEPTS